MESLTRTRKIGGSLVVTIPKEIVKEEGLREGEVVKIDVERPKRSGFGMFPQLGRFSEKDRLDTHE